MKQLGVKAYQIDVSKDNKDDNLEVLLEFFKNRGSKFDDKMLKENSFLLCNQFNDMWL